jgi:hypothetical protein
VTTLRLAMTEQVSTRELLRAFMLGGRITWTHDYSIAHSPQYKLDTTPDGLMGLAPF